MEDENPHAIELYHQDGRSAGIFYCSKCRCVAKTEGEANTCCGEKLCKCGKPTISKYQAQCHDCWIWEHRETETKKEWERFEKARKITPAEYSGEMVFHEDHYYNDEKEIEPAPEYVWATKNVGLTKASTQDVTERILDNAWDEAEESDLNGIDELAAAIMAFNEANQSIPVYLPDYSTAIVLTPQRP